MAESFHPKKKRNFTPFVVIFILLAGLAAAFVLVRQSQDIRDRAAGGENRLVCANNGNRWDSNSITVTNNTAAAVPLTIQENFCDYNGEAIPLPDGYRCDESDNSHDETIAPGESKTYTMTVPSCTIGQLDVWNPTSHVNDDPSECYNIPDGQTWLGGIAFAIKGNSNCNQQPTSTPVPTSTGTPAPTNTPAPTATPQPTTPPGQPTYTPVPTSTSTPGPTSTPVPTNAVGQPQPTIPVSGNATLTVLGLFGGAMLLILGLL